MEIKIREATLKDSKSLASLCELLGYSIYFKELESRLKEILKDDEHIVYVAQNSKDEIVGWVHAYIYKLFYTESMVELGGIVVDKSSRKFGIGKQLMDSIEIWGNENNCSSVILRSNSVRVKAHKFYENLGYENIKKQKTFYKKLK